MQKFLPVLAFGAIASASAIASDQNNYFGANVTAIEYSESGISDDATLTAIYGRFGTFFTENFSGELRAGLGVGDDDVFVGGFGNVNVELDNFFGAYLRAGVPVNDTFYPYGIIGVTRAELDASALGVSASGSETDVSFGVGLDVNLNDGLTINAEYINLLDKDGGELDAFAVGLSKSF